MLAQLVLLGLVASAMATGHYGGHYGGHLHYAAAAPIVKAIEPIYAPQPYKFGYESVDEWGNKQNRQETSDAHNNKVGSYGYTDAHGIYRQVNYIADAHGFRATVHTNEPGTAPSAPAGAVFHAPAVAKVVSPVVVKGAAAFAYPAYAHAPYGHHGHHGHHGHY